MGGHDLEAAQAVLVQGMVDPEGAGYQRAVAYGKHKVDTSAWKTFLLAVCGGWWIGLAGHIATIAASSFYITDKTNANSVLSPGLTKFAYGTVFPIGFMCLIFTRSELYTGNTMAMSMYAYHEKKLKALLHLLSNWGMVLVGNFIGCVFTAFFLSWLTDTFEETHDIAAHQFLTKLCNKKLGYNFGVAVIQAIGCNVMVCVSTFAVIIINEAVGKLVAIWFLISAFCFGNFEHIVANFYTLSICAFAIEGVNYGEVIYKNFIPVLIGNTIGGAFVCGAVWWILLSPAKHTVHPSAEKTSTKAGSPAQ